MRLLLRLEAGEIGLRRLPCPHFKKYFGAE
jgi:hypothetical protein